MKQKNLILLLALWAFSSNICLSMENFGPQELFTLAKNDSWDTINAKLNDYNGDINATNNDGLTLLHLAILAEQIECVKTLINKNANVNIHSTKGPVPTQLINRSWRNRIYTPLHCAAHVGNINIINLLLDAGADIDSTYQNDESTPLHLAAWFGYPNCVQLLIDKGAQINKTNLAGSTPVHSAAWREKPECLNLLINRGAAFEDKNSTGTGNTPLYLAAKAGSLECLHILMEHSPNKKFIVNLRCAGEGITPVQIAINIQNFQCMWDLIINGANINAKVESKSYKDIVALARSNKPLETFIKHIQKYNTAPIYNGQNALCFLCNKAYNKSDVIVELTRCKDSFHADCLKKYSVKDFCIKNPDNPWVKGKPRAEAEFLIHMQGYSWDEIKYCPRCNTPSDLINAAKLTVFSK